MVNGLRLSSVLVVAALLAWSLVGSAQSREEAIEPEVFLGITKSKAEKIRLTLFPISGSGVPDSVVAEIEQRLIMDLNRSGFFTVDVAPRTQVRPPERGDLLPLRPTGAKGAVWGSVTSKKGELILEGRLYDVAGASQLLGKRYMGKEAYARLLVHRFADDTVYQFTGEQGIAQSRVVYVSDRTDQKELYIMDYDGDRPRRITGERSLALGPRWTPDGQWITYLCYRSGNPDICVIDLTNNKRWKLVQFPGLNISPAWSPNGEWMAFATTRGAKNLELQLIDRAGKKTRRLTFSLGDDLSPSWSPTGRQLVFTSDRGGTPQLYIMDADGSNVRRLTFQGSYNTNPAWSPRGDWIAYTCRRNGWMRLCLISPDGREGGVLIDPDRRWNDEAPTWSPNGRNMIFTSNRSGRYQLYFVHQDGSGLEALTRGDHNRVMPAWSPR